MSYGRRPCQQELLAFRRKPTSLIVGQPEPPITELFLKYSNLLPQVLNRRLLMLVDPTSKDADEELPRLEDLGHRASLRVILAVARLLLASAHG